MWKIHYSRGRDFVKVIPMKLKKSSVDAAEAAGPTVGGAFVSERLRNPADELAVQAGPSVGDKIGGICAIIATVLLAAITFMLYVNWNLIKSA